MKPMLMIAAVALLGLAGCKDVGDACSVSGDGFTRRDPCAALSENICLNWEITCPDGQRLTPNECVGAVCGEGGDCPNGQICLQIDAFPQNSRCVKADLCD
ncbi:MAG: hypothetical protein KC613_25785 [Myxococcales bacterium]|nr:hypothetical protein [Myxococcales bacterium]MCB9525198.1 hypothetical protein [Myxococcales bacterium]